MSIFFVYYKCKIKINIFWVNLIIIGRRLEDINLDIVLVVIVFLKLLRFLLNCRRKYFFLNIIFEIFFYILFKYYFYL